MIRSVTWMSLLFLMAGFAATSLSAQTVPQWQRYELEIKTPVRYDNGNPYKDLELRVFWSTTLRTTDLAAPTGFGFWDGTRMDNGQMFNIFKIRTALPRGTYYLWHKCSGITSGVNCGSDPALNRAASAAVTFTVTANTRPDNLLYTNGFLQVGAGERFLKYTGDPTRRFYWQGDTAWPAFSREGKAMMDQRATNPTLPVGSVSNTWRTYVDKRAQQGYTVIQVAPAVAWEPRRSEPKKSGCGVDGKDLIFESATFPFPGPETFAFDQISTTGCTGAIPNNCSRWRPAYWQEVDAMVEYANSKGVVIMMVGMADPSDRGHCKISQDYPTKEDSKIFARNFAARLSGNHVVFSVNFDDWPDAVLDADAPGNGTVHDTTLLVGPELKRVAPRHLVSNHMAGSAPVTVYTRYHSQSWLNLHLYQSGHALNLSTSCPGTSADTWQNRQKCAISRALEIPKTLRALTPAKPVVNGEGPYEYPERDLRDPLPPDSRYGMRHGAYVSLLGGAVGFTAGVHGEDPPKPDDASTVSWDRPLMVLNSPGIKDMPVINRLLMTLYPGGTTSWGEFTRADGILIDPAQLPPNPAPAAERRLAAGSQGDNFVVYVPNSARVQTSSNLRGFDCRRWTVTWRNPRGAAKTYSPCPLSQASTSFVRPEICSQAEADKTGACDWVLVLQRPKSSAPYSSTGLYLAASLVEASQEGEPILTGGGDQMISQLMSSEDQPVTPETMVNPSEEAFYGLPSVAKEPLSGTSWVVWEAEGSTSGDSTDIFARLVAADGSVIGEAFLVNQQTIARQYDPFTVVDTTGAVTVVWASVGNLDDPDKPKADIFARRFRADGTPLGNEFLVNQVQEKNQDSPVAGADAAGNLVIGWLTKKKEIRIRLFSASGSPASPEILVNSPSSATVPVEWSDLVEIVVDPLGGFVVRWNEYSTSDELIGWYARTFNSTGQPMSETYVEVP